jgi:6-phosphofructokinase 1
MPSLIVLTSGGDSPGMNACVRAAAKVGAARGVRVLGAMEGYEGLIDGRFRELTREDGGGRQVPDPELDAIGGLGGTIIGSARSARFRTPEGRAAAAKRLAGIDGLIVVGGNGSLTGAHALAREHGIRVIGIPASIDNDIGCTGTAIGVDTALNTIVEACDRISDTARAHRRAFVVEVMGRQCGYLAMASAVAAGADAVLFREQGASEAALVERVAGVIRDALARGKRRVLIIKAEGVEMPCTRMVQALEDAIDGVEVRGTVLGHVVRGGNPSFQDRMVAGRFAYAAVEGLLAGQTDQMVAWQSSSTGGVPTADPPVQRFGLEQVLAETESLINGTSPVTRRRLQLLQAVEGVLSL